MKKENLERIVTAVGGSAVTLMKSEGVEVTSDTLSERIAKKVQAITEGQEPMSEGGQVATMKVSANNKQELPDMLEKAVANALASHEEQQAEDAFAASVEKEAAALAHKEEVAKASPQARAAMRKAPINDAAGTDNPDEYVIKRTIEMMPISKYAQRGEDCFSLTRLFKALKTGDWSHAQVEKGLTGQIDEFGGYTVPDVISDQIIELLREEVIVEQAGVRTIPMTSMTLGIPVLTSGTSAKWEGLQDAALTTSDTPEFGLRSLIAKKITSLLPVPNDFINDSSLNVESFLMTEMSRELGQEIDKAWLVGDGTTEPIGISNFEGIGTESAISLSAATIDTVRALILKTRIALGRATTILTHPTVTDHFMSLKDANGRPLVNFDPKEPDVLKMQGLPIHDSVNCVDSSGNFPLMVLPISEVIIGKRGTISIDKSEHAGFTSDVTWFRAIQRLDLTIARPATVSRQIMNNS